MAVFWYGMPHGVLATPKMKPRGNGFMLTEGLFATGRKTAVFYCVWSFLDAGRVTFRFQQNALLEYCRAARTAYVVEVILSARLHPDSKPCRWESCTSRNCIRNVGK